ncbi:selenocysteine-specific translation elongation factor, partial [Desulfovibrio sp. OttesenSCG-928-A18]|nr:selenocysteine-specific translation elongation factor [Desulfovibrio sp. OttesenSCG-928-A18]
MPVIMGTAGHIDHGKTTLIHALTGTDCDRLEEEKRRGITISLGFAELPLPGKEGRSLSVVDVPGHERFVRTMVAGAAGVDFVLMVIAADEGVMPQTREHLEICSLLGIRTGLVALTKIDTVDAELLALAEDDIKGVLVGSALEGAPIIPVSARNGQGMDLLLQALSDLEASLAPVRSQDIFRLPVDRVFTLRGHGTVVTGTMIAGSVSVGDSVELYPRGLSSKVRGLQSHGQAVQTALAGRRTAVNIPDLAVEEVQRGEVLSHPDTLFPSRRWTMRVSCLPSSPRALRHRAEVHLHHGAREMQARLYFADRDKLQPGESCLCEVRLPEADAAVFADRTVIRAFSPLRTVAGGVILNPLGVNMRRRSVGFAERCAMLEALLPPAGAGRLSDSGATGALSGQGPAGRGAAGADSPPGSAPAASDEERVHTQILCTEGAENGLSFARLRILANLDSKALEKTLAALQNAGRVFCFDREQRLYVGGRVIQDLEQGCLNAVAAHHKRFSEKQGIRRSELGSGWAKELPHKLAHFIIERLLKQKKLVAEGEYLRQPGHSAFFSKEQAPLSEALLKAHREAGLSPPNTNDLLTALNISKKEAAPVLAALRASGELVRVAEGVWYCAQHLKSAEQAVRDWFSSHETMD